MQLNYFFDSSKYNFKCDLKLRNTTFVQINSLFNRIFSDNNVTL
jgi:hypothetical protein